MSKDEELFSSIYEDCRVGNTISRKNVLELCKRYIDGEITDIIDGVSVNIIPNIKRLDMACYDMVFANNDKQEFNLNKFLKRYVPTDFDEKERIKLLSDYSTTEKRYYKPLSKLIEVLNNDISCELPAIHVFIHSVEID